MSLWTLALAAAERTWWTHDLDPAIVQFTDQLAIRWYGLAYAVGALGAWWWMRRMARAGRLPFRPNEVEDFVLYGAFLPMFIGGRVGYCLLYGLDRLMEDPLYLFRVWEGGMASHGGILGLIVGVALWARRHDRSLPVLYDAVCATAPFGVLLGRLANFVNGELWGRPSEVPWAVIFPEATAGVDAGIPTPRHPSQLYAAALEGLVVLAVAQLIFRRTRRPGLTAGCALGTYAVVRFCDELFRQPDRGYDLFFGWMSKGQLYSIPLLLLGAWVAARALWRPEDPAAFEPPPAKAAKTSSRSGPSRGVA